MRAMDGGVSIDFMALSSYGGGTTSSGEVRLIKDLDYGLEGRHVIIVEDIVDTGLTLHYLQEILRARNPKSLRTACLLSKPSRRKIDVTVDYIGFTIEDRFVVGYGLDYSEQYRNLPYIGICSQTRMNARRGPDRRPCRAAAQRPPARSASALFPPRISTRPLTIVVSTSSPRVT